MQTKLYFSIFASLLLLNACATQSQPTNLSVNNTEDKLQADTQLDARTQDLLALQDQLNRLVQEGDEKKCSDLQMPQFKESCEANILAARAIKSGSNEECLPASNEEIKKRCEFLFDQDLKTKEPAKSDNEKVKTPETSDTPGASELEPSIDKATDADGKASETESDVTAYIGLTTEDAQKKAEAEGKRFRVEKEDGEGLAVTMDFVPGRLNATVEKGKVVSIDVEG